ncbi:MAG: Methionine-tRNA ligase [Candidatus Nomurabacteria bacterium GW2011_GWB1_37_5]|uniref:Methionine--tRNA ligase n=1 Tax=Candidatus Nomurabacteria bacterium GW2011_GWB1_37_5 TaxID=1618742 RepID=A0A0G0GZJ0_9BACT|nr:MAG: Methionine-tRNA ligase [Candidatus Nomurabacteria bacterium GW2011_GWB1_37_5]
MGHALEFVRADIIARYKRMTDLDVFFNTGADEHGMKIYREAGKQGKDPQAYADFYAERMKGLIGLLGLSEFNFVRTTDADHVKAAQEFWKKCDENGYIYKKSYKAKYCVGCEAEKTDSELVNAKCPDHPNLEIEFIEEENYFFKFSLFQEKLLELYREVPDFVIPDFRYNEIKAFVARGLEDFSISRLKSKMPWGIEVPGDPLHIMYVWFDALVNYISAVGWPSDMKKFNDWWPVTQYCGKDNLRYQSAIWQAMLMAAGLPPSKQIIINGFITGAGGIKMSKTLGNVVDPREIINEYGAEALRFYLAREINQFEDSPFTKDGFKESYNANLANGLGNLISRIMKMAESNLDGPVADLTHHMPDIYSEALEAFDIKKAAEYVWKEISVLDSYIQEKEPFKLVKEDKEKAKEIIIYLVKGLNQIAYLLQPILPTTSAEIFRLIKENKSPEKPLFLRKI